MKWKINSLSQDDYDRIYNELDKDLVLDRLSYVLNKPVEDILCDIEENEIFYLLSTILKNRNIDVDGTMNHLDKYVYRPNIITNLDKAVALIKEYCDNPNSLIAIFADYDADGINAGYIAQQGIGKVNKGITNLKYPERAEGYGLNMNWCKDIVKSERDVLVITVDNGITKVEEVEFLKANGVQVIITDHHASQETVPDCIVVDPHNEHEVQDENTKGLCGAGIAFKLVQLLHEQYNLFDMYEYIPFFAIATITDVMPLNKENLAIIQYGLEIMNGDDCPIGIRALLNNTDAEVVTLRDIAWTVGPIINASGRIASPLDGAKVLFATTEEQAIEAANNLIAINEERKELTKEAKKELNKCNFDNDNVCIYINEKYPGGIVGIIAGEGTKLFNKPTIVLSEVREGIYHGSVRSVNGIDMLSILMDMREAGIIEDCGGHGVACVCNIKAENLQEAKDYFNRLDFNMYYEVEEILDGEETLEIDEVISLDHLNKTMYALSSILPTDDKSIPSPTFAIKELQVVSYNLSKNNPENLKLVVKQGRRKRTFWAWGLGSKYVEELGCPTNISIAGPVEKCFMTGQYILRIKDIA